MMLTDIRTIIVPAIALGFALNCERVFGQSERQPTHPQAARSYPASVAERLLEGQPTEEAVKTIPKIVGGKKAKPGDFPWQTGVILAKAPENDPFRGFFCGGSLIDWRWVLTAAHCTFKDNPAGQHLPPVPMSEKEIHIYLGSHNFTGGQRIAIDKIVRRADYNPQTMDNDVALLELVAEPGTRSGLKLLGLASEADADRLEPDKSARVSGWGSTEAGVIPIEQREAVQILMHVTVEFQPRGKCNTKHVGNMREEEEHFQKTQGKGKTEIKKILDELFPADFQAITDNMICAGTGDGSGDACFGDSGGPLVIKRGEEDAQAGIVSWGPAQGCGLTNLFGVYARATRYLDWIDKTTK